MGVKTRVVLKSTTDEITVYEALNAFNKFNKKEGNFNGVNLIGKPYWDNRVDDVAFYSNSTSFFINVCSTNFEENMKLTRIEENDKFNEKYGLRQVHFFSTKLGENVCFENEEKDKNNEVIFSLGGNEEAVDYFRKFGLFVMNNKQELFGDKKVTLYLNPYDYNDDIELFLKENEELKFNDYYVVIEDHRKDLILENKIDEKVSTENNSKKLYLF